MFKNKSQRQPRRDHTPLPAPSHPKITFEVIDDQVFVRAEMPNTTDPKMLGNMIVMLQRGKLAPSITAAVTQEALQRDCPEQAAVILSMMSRPDERRASHQAGKPVVQPRKAIQHIVRPYMSQV